MTVRARLDWYAVNRPCRGESVSGDATVVAVDESVALLGIVDALGHGREAHEVATAAEACLQAHWTPDHPEPLAAIGRLNAALEGTRGAAAGLAVLDRRSGHVRYAGIGNTGIRKFGDQPTSLVSRDGIIGHQVRRPLEQKMLMGSRDVLLLHTDGISSRFEPVDYAQMQGQTARDIAMTVLQQYGKAHDDAACICVRFER